MTSYVKSIFLEDVSLQWSNTRMPYFIHGLQLQRFSYVTVKDFNGSASPINKTACRVDAENGYHFAIDNKVGAMMKNIK